MLRSARLHVTYRLSRQVRGSASSSSARSLVQGGWERFIAPATRGWVATSR